MAVVAHLVGQVLAEGPAVGHVDDLQPPADREDRHRGRQGRGQQGALGLVPGGVHALGERMGVGAVGGRIDVPAPGQHQRIEPVIAPPIPGSGGSRTGRPPAAATASG